MVSAENVKMVLGVTVLCLCLYLYLQSNSIRISYNYIIAYHSDRTYNYKDQL